MVDPNPFEPPETAEEQNRRVGGMIRANVDRRMSARLPRENVYTCARCGRYTVTVDVDRGTTPYMIACRASGKEGDCLGTAYSSCYPKGARPDRISAPAWEWFKPTGSEYNKLSDAMKAHVDNGGLDLRPRTSAEPVYHA